ncbi:hypothetical protein FWH09_01650 [Candidatus Saccharibacteria bacterium]|nr:hypothetical protein [Candidatus Saccharibacteria bacterium]
MMKTWNFLGDTDGGRGVVKITTFRVDGKVIHNSVVISTTFFVLIVLAGYKVAVVK